MPNACLSRLPIPGHTISQLYQAGSGWSRLQQLTSHQIQTMQTQCKSMQTWFSDCVGGLYRLSLGGLLGLLTVLLGAHAGSAQTRPQVWIGTGQVVSGQGQGATVQLELEVGNGYIRTRSGPPLNTPFSPGSQAIQTADGLWQIDPQGNQLSVILHRGDQIIRYQLTPMQPVPQDPVAPVNPGESVNPVNPVNPGDLVDPVDPGDAVPPTTSPPTESLVPAGSSLWVTPSHGPARIPLVPVVRDVIVPHLEPASNNE